VKTSLWFPVLLTIAGLAGCSGSASNDTNRPAANEKSVTESAQDYLMDPVRQKKKAVKELDEALAKRDSNLSKQLEEATER
jgi:hypothetical protein